MSKPEWRDAPEWANWLAQNINGEWWWYAAQPWRSLDGCKFHAIAFTKHALAIKCTRNRYWAETLERRP